MEKETLVTPGRKYPQYRWTILSLVFFATTINYLDRQIISLLKDDYLEPLFGWSETDYSNIVIAFQITYALGMIMTGALIDKIGTRYGYAISFTVWSLATIMNAFAKSIPGFMFSRGILGISQAGNFPAAIKTVAEWFPKHERALATGIFNSGTNVGAILAPFIVAFIAAVLGWKWAFIIPGALGLIWLVFWFILYETPQRHGEWSKQESDQLDTEDNEKVISEPEVKIKWLQLLKFRQTWSFAVLKFFSDPIWWFLLFWLPSFLNKQYGMTKTNLVLPIALVYLMAMFGSVAGGWLSGYLINKGWPVYKARRGVLLLYALLALPMLSAQTLGAFNYWYAVLIIGIAASAHQAWSANIFTTVSDMFPKKAVASVVGIGGMVGAVGGVIIARVAGLLLDYYKSLGDIEQGYKILFIICALSYLVAWSLFSLLVPKMEKVKF